MSEIAIRCDGLSKQYRIGERESYKALRDVITDAATAPFRRLRAAAGNGANGNGSSVRNPNSEIRNSFWALDDVSFEVKRGEVVGIIGRNGAGKSTLLKILSRITKPTRGHAKIHGRVGSLLEVGTGFHPELTGRENIYLNAAILGMRKAEVERKFDEIVAFAEVEKFIDTPVKRYSSGMYLRLAFSVAAHLESEILLVDEVLAVGDADFQKKCLGKMKSVSGEGRTVMLVSHNIGAVKRLCDKTLYIRSGRLQSFGPTDEVVAEYISQGLTAEGRVTWAKDDPQAGDRYLRLESLTLRNELGEATSDFDFREPISIEFAYEVEEAARVRLILGIHNDEGVLVFVTGESETEPEVPAKVPGRHQSTCRIPGHFLSSDRYYVSIKVDIQNYRLIGAHENVLGFQVHASSTTASLRDGVSGIVSPTIKWETQEASDLQSA
jgi:lipopolysaccharide transport system ATP-binding protein